MNKEEVDLIAKGVCPECGHTDLVQQEAIVDLIRNKIQIDFICNECSNEFTIFGTIDALGWRT